ncbi:MAG: hypothetical protein PVI81_05950 [Anaerolineales bacterium]|jgi:hypothetical protein
MLESKHAGYSSAERYAESSPTKIKTDGFERIIRLILVICFFGVLGLEFWLLISALGNG